MQLLVQVEVGSRAFAQRAENGSFDNTQLNFVSDFVTLLAAKVVSMLQNYAWVSRHSSWAGGPRRRILAAEVVAGPLAVVLVRVSDPH